MQGVKPMKLAAKYRLDKAKVTQMITDFKMILKKTLISPLGEVDGWSKAKVPIVDNIDLITTLQRYLMTNGMHNITLSVLKKYVKDNLPSTLKRVPDKKIIS